MQDIGHVIGNPLFAIETNLESIKKRLDATSQTLLKPIFDDVDTSLVQLKEKLYELKEEQAASQWKEFDLILEEFDKPFWVKGNEEGCKHESDEYIGSFTQLWKPADPDAKMKQLNHDVYLRKDNGVCIRHSDEPSDYSGIPNVEMMVQYGMIGHAVENYALRMIVRKKFPREKI